MSASSSGFDAGAGLKLTSKTPPAEQKGQPSVFSKALSLSTYFLSGVLSINLSQFLGTPLYLVNKDWYNAWIAFTKQSFGILTMGLTQAFAPTTVIVSGDASVRGQLQQYPDGNLKLQFPDRMVLIANHQIYTDWLYLWWIAYCNGVHGRLYIILKESLKRIPVIGWGMQLSQFIFLKRDWEQDKPHLSQALQRLNKSKEPMWLLLFPEGTNLAPCTREKSAKWAEKNGIKDTKHVLLPRSTGLQFCLDELKNTVDYLYDCTIAYEGVPRGEFAQDIFTLKAGYLEGKPPKSVSMYWRRFAIKDIPIHDPKSFQLWLNARWREKDLLIENYLRFGRFPADVGSSRTSDGRLMKGRGRLNVQIRPSHWYEFLQIFAPMGILAMVLYIFYGALPQKMWDSINKEALETSADDLKKLGANSRGISASFDSEALFDKTKQAETFQKLGMSLAEVLRSPEAQSAMSRAGLVQKWLEDPQQFILDNLEHLGDEQKPERSFLKELEAEERKRQGKNQHHGTFWRDLEALEARKASANHQAPSTAKSSIKRKPPKLGPPKLGPSKKKVAMTGGQKHTQSFWDDLKAEENSRYGSVVTLSSDASSTNVSRRALSTAATSIANSEPKNKPIGLTKTTGGLSKQAVRISNGTSQSVTTKKPLPLKKPGSK